MEGKRKRGAQGNRPLLLPRSPSHLVCVSAAAADAARVRDSTTIEQFFIIKQHTVCLSCLVWEFENLRCMLNARIFLLVQGKRNMG